MRTLKPFHLCEYPAERIGFPFPLLDQAFLWRTNATELGSSEHLFLAVPLAEMQSPALCQFWVPMGVMGGFSQKGGGKVNVTESRF